MNEHASDGSDVFVEIDGVREAGQFAFRTAQDLLDALRSAGAEVDGLMAGGWTGTAADAYGAGWCELRDGGIQVFEALSDMAELLGVTAEDYSRQDHSFSSSLSSLRLD
jgi:uncharacterized protein YukE